MRIIAATNRELEKAVADGSFREDLYYRLDVIPIRLPPLRLRTGDIPLLVGHFLEKFSQDSGKAAPALTSEAMHVLLGHEWRGNVRELENLIERIVAFAWGSRTDCRRARVAPPYGDRSVAGGIPTIFPRWPDLEGSSTGSRRISDEGSGEGKWVKKRAAGLLRLNSRSFRYRLEKYAIKGGRD